MARSREPQTRTYELRRLFDDQEPELVVDAIPALLAWVSGPRVRSTGRCQFAVIVTRSKRGKQTHEVLELTWDVAHLRAQDAEVVSRAKRMHAGSTSQREHVTELAAYALALVAISVFLPGRRVMAWNQGAAPDILFDVTPGRLRGVEVAGRTRGGNAALRAICDGSPRRPGKRARLLACRDVVEAHLSLWSGSPRVAMMLKVKP